MVQNNLTEVVVERGGVQLAYHLISNPSLPLPVREDGFKLLLLLAEDYHSLEQYISCGAHKLVCYYMSPVADSNVMTRKLCHAILQALYIYDDKYSKYNAPSRCKRHS